LPFRPFPACFAPFGIGLTVGLSAKSGFRLSFCAAIWSIDKISGGCLCKTLPVVDIWFHTLILSVGVFAVKWRCLIKKFSVQKKRSSLRSQPFDSYVLNQIP
jgi:hypothetical protein